MATPWTRLLSRLRRVGLDSNAIIYHLNERSPYEDLLRPLFQAMETGQVVGVISTLVEMEVLVKPWREQDREALERIEMFFRATPSLIVRPGDRQVARRAAVIRADTRLSAVDAVILATGILERCDAIIGNDAQLARRAIGVPCIYLNDYIP